MQIEPRKQGTALVIALNGRFDAFEAPKLMELLEPLLGGGQTQVVLNLGGVNFIDSSALGTLVKVMKRCKEKGGELRLCAIQQAVQVILELTQLHRAFIIHPDESSALTGWVKNAPASGFSVETQEQVVRIITLVLVGRLDVTTASIMREKQDALLEGGGNRFILDLRDVSFMDSGGFATLVNLLKRARSAGGEVVMVMPHHESVRRIILLTKFDRVFTIADTPEQARDLLLGGSKPA